MKQPLKINIINSIILLVLVVSATLFILRATSLSNDAANGIFLVGLLIACLMFGDWYSLNTTNSFKNCFYIFLGGPILAFLIIILNILFNDVSFQGLVAMNADEFLKIMPFRLLLTGMAFPFMAVIGVIRLIVIYIFTDSFERESAGIST